MMLVENLIKCVVAFAVASSAYALADTFNMKTGTWEITFTTVTTGMPIPADALARMVPEQRARIEKTLRARDGKPSSLVKQSCVTKNDLDQNHLLLSADENRCKKKIITKSASKIAFQQTCAAPRASTTKVEIEANTPERIAASMDIVQNGASGKIHVGIKGRWLSAKCSSNRDGG